MKKVSILMPTYNDCSTIEESLDSLISQTYTNWELIIIDDGSTDKTKDIIQNYIENHNLESKIIYIYQENADQLRAIINGINYITGDYVYVLHSDDLLYDETSIEKNVKYLEEHPQTDGIIGDLTLINEKSEIFGIQRVNKYLKKEKIKAIQLLWLGRNLYIDLPFVKKEIFITNVYENYLKWNKPFWININDKVDTLNIDKVNYSFYKYRIYSGNYANNELGQLCLINGEIRTATQLMKFYEIPFYKLQYIVYRIFCKLNLFSIYMPIYLKRETKNKYKIVDFILRKRYPDGYENNIYFKSLAQFYKKNNKRSINFDKLYNGEPIYLGNDLRTFNKQLLNGTLPILYIKMFEEMNKGFSILEVSKKNEEAALNLLKFLSIYPFVEIRCKNERK